MIEYKINLKEKNLAKQGLSKIKILIFIGSMGSGGKERRLIELLGYLKNKPEFDFKVVLTKPDIHYPTFLSLGIDYEVLPKALKNNDITVFYNFYKACKKYRPDIIHTWGRMQSFYTLPVIIGNNKINLINSQITSAPPKQHAWSILKVIDRLNFKFSKLILSNSWAGIESYAPPLDKSKVIYNGINLNRFKSLPPIDEVKLKYNLKTPYTILMSASFTPNKDHRLFLRIAEKVTKLRNDITFISVGGYDNTTEFHNLVKLSSNNPRILYPGRIDDVEALINACTIGVLFSNREVHGEGISNSVMEYMTLGKPVIANDAGGTREIVYNNENGYLISDHSEDEIIELLCELVDNEEKRKFFGQNSKKIIRETFSLEKMGNAFEQVYKEALI